ncbi:MAG: hypothetical protein HKN21_02925 [Candidatus Eisenbacteria bacterium]|uniref:DUF1761 domain-containing protein n=1 Tax=Eiseniibacteriota bacterium TaxID=2212470 RepID=A0A7Y2H1I5_UNCEI|nr:hypothetical protein [Candidatus Eisenbacteria bacterium]
MKLVLGAILSGVVLMIWGFIFWATPISAPAYQHTPNAEVLGEALLTHLPADGTYIFPDMQGLEESEFIKRHEAGPLATIHFRSAGVTAMEPMVFVKGFLHYVVTALVLGILLTLVGVGGRTYGSKVMIIFVAGLAAMIWSGLTETIWFYHPMPYHMAQIVYGLVSWLLMGLVLGAFIKAKR